MFTFFFQLSHGKNASWWRFAPSHFRATVICYLLQVCQGLCAQPFPQAGPGNSNGSKMFPRSKTPPQRPFPNLPPAPPCWHTSQSQSGGMCIFWGTWSTFLFFQYWLQQQQEKKSSRQEHCGSFIFHLGAHIKKLNPCRSTCFIKKTSVLEKVLWSGASCQACVTAAYLCSSQLGRRVGNHILRWDEGCAHTGLRTHALSCPVAIIAESCKVCS